MLVTRGNQEVVKSVATNNGARLSEFGFLHMIQRAEGDSILAEQLGLRKDIPRHIFQQLIAKASDDVKSGSQDERPNMVDKYSPRCPMSRASCNPSSDRCRAAISSPSGW